MILKVFLCGMLAVIPAVFAQLLFLKAIEKLPFSPFLILILSLFIGVALVEEVTKYLVVRFKVLGSSELDEPLDVMLYMIIAALGFAALENVFYLFGPEDISDVFWTNIFRFLGAVFGHALWAGTLGYFLALSFYKPKEKLKLLALGLFLAIALHGAFDYAIIQMIETEKLAWFDLIVVMTISLAIFVTLGFKKLQKMKSVCLPGFTLTKPKQASKIN